MNNMGKKQRKKRQDIRKRARRIQRVTAAACNLPEWVMPEEILYCQAELLLTQAAGALNDLERYGIHVKLMHNALVTDWGYLFRFGDDHAPWVTRSLKLSEFQLPVRSRDDDG
jgi:hypothetical protein